MYFVKSNIQPKSVNSLGLFKTIYTTVEKSYIIIGKK